MTTSDGSTASYYELPEGAKELQDLISYRNLNAQDGEIFRAIYRKGRASHSDELRDARKVLFYAKAEVERLERLKLWDDGEKRIDIIAASCGQGEHYISADDGAGVWAVWYGGECPVDEEAQVEVMLRNGDKLQVQVKYLRWNHIGNGADITRYRLI